VIRPPVAESDDADADRAVCPGQNASAGRAAAVSKTSSSLTERDELNRPAERSANAVRRTSTVS
jgi:hypothetical protein